VCVFKIFFVHYCRWDFRDFYNLLAAYMEFVRYCPKTTGAYTESV